MSIDFDSAALQTQQEEEDEYDQEDYAREQELHKLLTDLPDDMLEDSRDGSSPETDDSACDGRSQRAWDHQNGWIEPERDRNGDSNYEQGSYRGDYSYGCGSEAFGSQEDQHHGWGQRPEEVQDYHTEYAYNKAEQQHATEGPYRQFHQIQAERDDLGYGPPVSRLPFQNYNSEEPASSAPAHYKVNYNPYQPKTQLQMFNPEAAGKDGRLEQLQREFLDTSHKTAEQQQMAQLQVLNKAHLRQIEELEQKMEEYRRNVRLLEHQSAIVKDEKDGMAVSLQESGRLLEESKERESQLQSRVKSLEIQVQMLADKEQESIKKLRAAESAVDSLQQQLAEVFRSETLSRARLQHDRDLMAIREQHEVQLLALQQKVDVQAQSVDEQTELAQRLREQLQQLERQREEERLERAAIINTLTKRLEESQQQCANLLQTGTMQETSQLRMQLQQAQAAKAISDNMTKSLQEEVNDLKEQITLYESAVKFGTGTPDSNADWENQLSDSYVELGIKKVNWKNSQFHSGTSLASMATDGRTKEELSNDLKAELQRLMGSLKVKRQKISQLQEELKQAQAQTQELKAQLDVAEKSARDSKVREISLEKHLEATNIAVPQEEVQQLQKDKKNLEDHVEKLEKQNNELKQTEEKIRAANAELCTKMREMIHELDQEKQEVAKRNERIQQQFRDDVVNRVRAELTQEHLAEVEELRAKYQQEVEQLQSKLTEVSSEIVAVQECYISICREKNTLEETLQAKVDDEAKTRERELRGKMEEEKKKALDELQIQLEVQHQTSREQWVKEKETELKKRVDAQLALCKNAWEEQHSKELQIVVEKVEKEWTQRLKEASMVKQDRCDEQATQTERRESSELNSRLAAQKLVLLQEAERAQAWAVQEAVQRSEKELQRKHLDDITRQVENAVSNAHKRWLQELTSHPEYKASLQAEKQDWEKQKERDLAQQISSLLKALEEKAKGEREVLESELMKTVQSLQHQLEQCKQAMSNKQAQNERQFSSFLDEQSRKLKQKEADIQRILKAETISEARTALEEIRDIFLRDPTLPEDDLSRTSRGSAGGDTGWLRAFLITEWRSLLHEGITKAQQNWKQVSDEKQSRLLREFQEQHEKEISRIRGLQGQGPICGPSCAEREQKLLKQSQDLQRHLGKTCRQLQHTVRDHKASMQQLKEEHTEAIRKEREENAKRLEEMKRQAQIGGSSGADSQQALQAGLEEMKEQYMKAVGKIRADMLRYIQESKERAAEIIRTEVLRERQDTARKMRRYYLTCLQELLEDGGRSHGAEKKIIAAASKLAAMAKVLETPVSRKQGGRNRSVESASNVETLAGDCNAKSTGPSPPGKDLVMKTGEIVVDKHTKLGLAESGLCHRVQINAVTNVSEQQILASAKRKELEGVASKAPPSPAPQPVKSDPLVGGTGDTPKLHSRELYPPAGRVHVLDEAPVRDGGQSDWSGISSRLDHVNTFPFSSETDDTDDDLSRIGSWCSYKDMPKALTTQEVRSTGQGLAVYKTREPIPGSEGERARRFCPKSLFPSAKARQQDSGFDSPLSLLQK